jgi:hypothetical protein
VKSLAALLTAILAVTGCSGTKNATVQAAAPKVLSDAYAIQALLALKSIQRDLFIPDAGFTTVGRLTQEKIDTADVAAVSPEEKSMTDTLNAVYIKHISINRRKDEHDRKVSEYVEASPRLSKKTNDAWIAVAVKTGDEIKSSQKQLDSCFVDLEASLRARSITTPASCK